MSKTKSIVILAITAVLIAFFGFACFVSFPIPGSVRDYNSVFSQISKGIDLEGGYYAVLTPNVEDESQLEKLNLDNVIQTLRTRLDSKGYTEASITRQDVSSLRVEIPDVDNPEEVITLLGSQGKLEFRDSSGTVYLTGEDVENAFAAFDENGKYAVTLQFTARGQEKFADATAKIKDMSDNKMGIYLGDTQVSNPSVTQTINNSSAQITGEFSLDEVQNLAAVISSGALDIDFSIGETRQISATLGEGVVNNAMIAAGIGLLIIFAIMIIFYGVMGVAASIALMIYVILYVIVLAIFPGVQLTFPGIAGIILSMGMAVDANVIIFDRIKEEFANGKTVSAAIKAGFRRALLTVVDSNITTILASVVLWILTSGSIRGFAITLFLGVIVSMFTALVVTRWFIKLFRPFAKDEEKFFGLVRREVQ